MGEDSEKIFGFLDFFAEVIWHGFALVFVHEGDLGAVLNSFLVEAEKDGVEADGGDEEGKKGEESELSERFHNIKGKEGGSKGDEEEVNGEESVEEIDFLYERVIIVLINEKELEEPSSEEDEAGVQWTEKDGDAEVDEDKCD